MLPPPITTPTMDIVTQQKHNLPMNQQSQTKFLLNNTKNSANSDNILSSSSNSLPTVPLNASSIKNFFNKTLANVAKTNFTDYTSQYSAASLNSSPDSLHSSNFSSNLNSTHALAADMVYDGLMTGKSVADSAAITQQANGFDTYAAAADMAVSTLSNGTQHLETTTAFPTAQTVATFIAGNKNRATTIIVYPTVSPESIVIPIVSCIFGFPILAFIVICCLRHRAKLARERDRRRNYDMQDHAVSLVRFSPIHRLNYRSSRAISLRPERSLSQGFTSLELDTVVEERCSDIEQTQTEILNPESPMESSTTSYKMSFSSS